MTTNTNRRAIVFRAPLLPHLFENWRETNTYARRGRMPAVTLNKPNFTAACAAKCPSAMEIPLMPYLTTAARAHAPVDNLPSINSLKLVCLQVTVYLCELHRWPRGTVL